MLGESVAYLTHATFLSKTTGEGALGRVTLELSKNKKESWPNMFTFQAGPRTGRLADLGACALRSATCSAKMPLLLSNQIVKDHPAAEAAFRSHNLPRSLQ